MKSQPVQRKMALHILTNISRRKGSQAMKLHDKYFSWKIVHKFDRKTIPRPFSKKPKLRNFLDQQAEVLYGLFLLYAKLRTIEI